MARRLSGMVWAVALVGTMVCAAADAPACRCVLEFEAGYRFDEVKHVRREDGGPSFQGLTKNDAGRSVGFTLLVPAGDNADWREFTVNMMGTKGQGTLQLDVPDARRSRRFASGNPDGDPHEACGKGRIRRTETGWQVELETKVFPVGRPKRGEKRVPLPAKLTFENVR